ncbi:OLC1v1013919C1 [Oldenlandia corymbosa var. corymbosa]|uniref:OLC1v1013919C1 n=1 Tax=Oldenlandia corymbosa var. corymbosa TaxID=529605 RepID=A0AAV1DZW4_OLDCO|nr:OLC1v1013919C1 [Oldenlandia corymbosa var. corymbosa]
MHQITWFKEYLNTGSNDPDAPERKKLLKKALVIIRGYGGNDAGNGIWKGWSEEEIRESLVPLIVESISNAVRKTIRLRATYIVVPKNLPQECFPIMLIKFPSPDEDYDKQGCLRNSTSWRCSSTIIFRKQ